MVNKRQKLVNVVCDRPLIKYFSIRVTSLVACFISRKRIFAQGFENICLIFLPDFDICQ